LEKQNNYTENLTDKAFSRLIFTSLFAVFICIFALCGVTYAWFTTTTTSNTNTLKSGVFDLDVTAVDASSADVTVTTDAAGVKSAVLTGGVTYTVSLKTTGTTNVSRGHCVVKIGGKTYHTGTVLKSDTVPFTFTITPAADGKVTFEAVWGSADSSAVIVENGGAIALQ